MSSEQLADGVNPLDAELAATWDILKGYSGRDTDLGIARRFGGSAAAYSLRDIGAMNGRVVRVRRNSDDTEEDFSANQVQSGVVENFCNEILTVGVAVEGGNGTDRPDSFTNATNSSFTATVTEVAGGYFPYTTGAGDVVTVSFDLVLSVGSSPSIATATSVNTVSPASNGAAYTSSGSYTFTATCTADATHIRFADGDDGTFAVTNFQVTSHISDGFVQTWYDQSGNGNNATQSTAGKQPKIVSNGGINTLEGLPTINFDDATSHCLTSSSYSRSGSDLPLSMIALFDKSTTDTDYLFAVNKSDNNAFQRFLMRSDSFEYSERDDANVQKVGTGGSPSLNTTFLISAFTAGTTSSAFVNGSSIFSDVDTDLGTQTFDQIDIGANNGDGASSSSPFSGNISELYLFETNLSTDRTTIETEINNHYNIF